MSKMFQIALTFALSLTVCLFSLTAYAGSYDWRFTHNDQDTLIIGEIISKDSDSITIKPIYYVVSAPSTKEQLRPEIAVVLISDYYDALGVGDYVAASLNKVEDDFSIAWGMYRLDSTNYKKLKIYRPDSTYRENYIEYFINNGIEYNEQNHDYVVGLLNGDDFDSRRDDSRAIIYPVGVETTKQARNISNVLSDIIIFLIFPICCITVFLIWRTMLKRKYEKPRIF